MTLFSDIFYNRKCIQVDEGREKNCNNCMNGTLTNSKDSYRFKFYCFLFTVFFHIYFSFRFIYALIFFVFFALFFFWFWYFDFSFRGLGKSNSSCLNKEKWREREWAAAISIDVLTAIIIALLVLRILYWIHAVFVYVKARKYTEMVVKNIMKTNK